MPYLLDANVFIQAKNLHYGLDFCPAFWEWLIDRNAAGSVFSIEKVGEDRLRDLLGESDVEPVATSARPEVQFAQDVAIGLKPRRPGPHALREKPALEPERFEDLHRPRVHDRRPIPAPRSVQHVDQQARHVASLQLRRQQQPGRAGADHEHL